MSLLSRTALMVSRFPGGSQVVQVARRLRGSSFFLNLLSVSGATLVSRLIGLITLGYAARVLGPENYGVVGFGASVAAYAGILLSPGLLTWGIRAVAREREKAGEKFLIVNLTQVVLACLAYAGLLAFALLFLNDPLEQRVVLLSGLVLFQTAISADWVLNGLELMRIPAGLGVLNSLLYTVALLSLVNSPDDILILPLLAPGIGILLSGAGYYILIRRLGVRLTFPGATAFRQALVSSLPLGTMAALVVVIHYANNLIVRAFVGAAALGVFLAAFRLLELAQMIPSILGNVFLPRLARFVIKTPEAAVREARLFAQVHMLAGFFVAAFMLAEAPAIINIIYGARYTGAAELLRFMAFAVLFNYAIYGYTNCLISFGRDRVMLLVVVTSAVVAVGGGLLLVPRLGALGAAMVTASIDLVGWLVSLPYYRRVVGGLQLRVWLLPALGAAAIVAVSLLLQGAGLPVWLRVPAGLLAYLPFAFFEVRSAIR